MARALEQPFGAVFPGAKPPPPGDRDESLLEWLRLGFDLNAPAPTWYLEFLLHGLEDPIKYLVDYEDALRVAATLEDRCGSPFIASNSCGREIYVNTRKIQRSTVEQDGTSLMPGVRHQIGALERHYGSLRVFIKGRDEPFTIPALDMDVGQLGGAFSDLEDHTDCSDLFLSFRHDEDNIISFAPTRSFWRKCQPTSWPRSCGSSVQITGTIRNAKSRRRSQGRFPRGKACAIVQLRQFLANRLMVGIEQMRQPNPARFGSETKVLRVEKGRTARPASSRALSARLRMRSSGPLSDGKNTRS